jgi:hypothetical protein
MTRDLATESNAKSKIFTNKNLGSVKGTSNWLLNANAMKFSKVVIWGDGQRTSRYGIGMEVGAPHDVVPRL